MTNSFPFTRKVGAPQAIFSLVSGNDRHILRTRASVSFLDADFLGAFRGFAATLGRDVDLDVRVRFMA
jgi:hypothetical protein